MDVLGEGLIHDRSSSTKLDTWPGLVDRLAQLVGGEIAEGRQSQGGGSTPNMKEIDDWVESKSGGRPFAGASVDRMSGVEIVRHPVGPGAAATPLIKEFFYNTP